MKKCLVSFFVAQVAIVAFAEGGTVHALTAMTVFTSQNAEIVIDKNAPSTVRFAAREMKAALDGVFGCEIPVATSPTSGKRHLYLGENEWTRKAGLDPAKLPRDAFEVAVTEEGVFIAGVDDPKVNFDRHPIHGCAQCATSHGVYEFLERYAGVRYFFPGELGTVYPRTERIVVPTGRFSVHPDYVIRHYSDHADGEWYEPLSAKERKIASNLACRRYRMYTERVPCCHGQYWSKFSFRFAKEHPEYFRLKPDGTRHTEDTERAPLCKNSHLCHSSDVWEEIYKDARSYLLGEPASVRGVLTGEREQRHVGWGKQAAGGKYYDVMPHDGLGGCCCERCQATFAAATNKAEWATELIWGRTVDVANRLKAEGVPGFITQMAYSPYGAIPLVDIPDNVRVMVACRGPWGLANPDQTAKDRAKVTSWAKKAKGGIWLWTYTCKAGRLKIPDIPFGSPHYIGRFYKEMKPWIVGAYLQSNSDRFLYTYMDYYVFGKVSWDNDVDLQALFADHDRVMFGPAAKPMREFFDILEEKWVREIAGNCVNTPVGPMTIPPDDYICWTEVYSPAVIGKLDSLLTAAAAKVPAGSLEARRIALFRREYFDRLAKRARDYLDSVSVEKELARRKAAKGRNLLANPGFEDGLTGWTPAAAGAVAIDTETVAEGRASVRISSESRSPAGPYVRAWVAQTLSGAAALKPNTKYRLSYFLRIKDIVCVQRDGGVSMLFTGIGPRGVCYPENPIVGSCGWTCRTFHFTTGPDCKPSATICCRMGVSHGTAWFDGLWLEEE